MQKTRYDDELDTKELEQIETLPNPWQRTFLKRFYKQMQKQRLRKKDIPVLLDNNADKVRFFPSGFVLPESTLSECTNFHPTKRNGKPKNLKTLSVDTLIAISLALQVSPNYLLGYDIREISKEEKNSTKVRLENEILNELVKNKDLITDDNLKQKIRQLEKYKKDASKKNLERPF